ncbi:MAG: FeoB-associated Cys-rich membrane protein [Prevotella sp.]|nr:FeoB-associated Cys-rich membrane protein [Prevotella sp.]
MTAIILVLSVAYAVYRLRKAAESSDNCAGGCKDCPMRDCGARKEFRGTRNVFSRNERLSSELLNSRTPATP